jgi:hypothetical protein
MSHKSFETEMTLVDVTYASAGLSDAMDTKNARKVQFIVKTNNTAGDGFTKIEGDDDSAFGSPSDIAGSSAVLAGSGWAWVAIELEPPQRYLRVTTVGQDECLMILKDMRQQPPVTGAGVLETDLGEPAYGTP